MTKMILFFLRRRRRLKGLTSAWYLSKEIIAINRIDTVNVITTRLPIDKNLHKCETRFPFGWYSGRERTSIGTLQSIVNKSAKLRFARRIFVVDCIERFFLTTPMTKVFPMTPITVIRPYTTGYTMVITTESFSSIPSVKEETFPIDVTFLPIRMLLRNVQSVF